VIGCFSREGKAWSIGGDANADGIFSDVGLVLAARGKEGFRISGEYARSAERWRGGLQQKQNYRNKKMKKSAIAREYVYGHAHIESKSPQ
jgi:hypothetical protein